MKDCSTAARPALVEFETAAGSDADCTKTMQDLVVVLAELEGAQSMITELEDTGRDLDQALDRKEKENRELRGHVRGLEMFAAFYFSPSLNDSPYAVGRAEYAST